MARRRAVRSGSRRGARARRWLRRVRGGCRRGAGPHCGIIAHRLCARRRARRCDPAWIAIDERLATRRHTDRGCCGASECSRDECTAATLVARVGHRGSCTAFRRGRQHAGHAKQRRWRRDTVDGQRCLGSERWAERGSRSEHRCGRAARVGTGTRDPHVGGACGLGQRSRERRSGEQRCARDGSTGYGRARRRSEKCGGGQRRDGVERRSARTPCR